MRVAISRDYADAPPTRGVYKGDANIELAVAVSVSRDRRAPNGDVALHAVRRQSQPVVAAAEKFQQQ